MVGEERERRIVVGVDGSPLSRDALRWAGQEAEVRACRLDVVYGWQVSSEPRPAEVPMGVAPPAEAYERAAVERIQGVVDEELPEPQRARAVVHVVHKPAGKALVAQARGADLLVIGSRTQGRLASWLLGSVSNSAVQNAPCAVALIRAGCVPADQDDDGDGDGDEPGVPRGAAAEPEPEPGEPVGA